MKTSVSASQAMAATSVLGDLRDMVYEQFEYREVLRQMTLRDLTLRYKQTVMGFGWAVLMPLVNTAVFSVIFTRVAPLDVGMAYPLYAFCGLLAWNFFASALRFSVTSLTSNQILVSKIYFPREIFPIAAVLVALVDFAVAMVPLAALMAYYHVPVGASLVLLPVVIAIHVIFTAAIGLLLAMGNLFYRDVKYLFEVAITVWMFATSVLYPVERVGGRLGTLLGLNPMTAVIDAYRSVLLLGTWPSSALTSAAIVSIALLAMAWFAFHRAEFAFAEHL
ncbi:MAG: phosphate ABC transporter permease [Acidobacteria bacterium]|nr:MAG: phosphate ABC transporter permease [Acidobacteriota bacterium]